MFTGRKTVTMLACSARRSANGRRRPTFLEFPDMRLGDSNCVGDLLERFPLLQPKLGNLHSQSHGNLFIPRVVCST